MGCCCNTMLCDDLGPCCAMVCRAVPSCALRLGSLTHDQVHLRHPPQQLLPLLLRNTACNDNLQVAHAVTLALGLQGASTHRDKQAHG